MKADRDDSSCAVPLELFVMGACMYIVNIGRHIYIGT
jgi:hypothetical protein